MGLRGRNKAVFWTAARRGGGGCSSGSRRSFTLRPLQTARQETAGKAFNRRRPSSKNSGTSACSKSSDKAVEAAALLAEIKADPKAARARHARTVGLNSTYYYYVSGTGRVVSVERNSVSLALGEGATPDVVIETGNIFGNAARDATGLLDVNDFAEFGRLQRHLVGDQPPHRRARVAKPPGACRDGSFNPVHWLC